MLKLLICFCVLIASCTINPAVNLGETESTVICQVNCGGGDQSGGGGSVRLSPTSPQAAPAHLDLVSIITPSYLDEDCSRRTAGSPANPTTTVTCCAYDDSSHIESCCHYSFDADDLLEAGCEHRNTMVCPPYATTCTTSG